MAVIYLVLPLAILLAIVALVGFAWAVRQGQYDDLDTPASRMLFDDEPTKPDASGSARALQPDDVEQ